MSSLHSYGREGHGVWPLGPSEDTLERYCELQGSSQGSTLTQACNHREYRNCACDCRSPLLAPCFVGKKAKSYSRINVLRRRAPRRVAEETFWVSPTPPSAMFTRHPRVCFEISRDPDDEKVEQQTFFSQNLSGYGRKKMSSSYLPSNFQGIRWF